MLAWFPRSLTDPFAQAAGNLANGVPAPVARCLVLTAVGRQARLGTQFELHFKEIALGNARGPRRRLDRCAVRGWSIRCRGPSAAASQAIRYGDEGIMIDPSGGADVCHTAGGCGR